MPQSLVDLAREDAFLSWFANQGFPIQERCLSFGGFRYHQFSALFPLGDRETTSHGRSEVRRTAALKCASEAVERRFMAEGFSTKAPFIPPALRTSNGWAVHQDEKAARTAAYREALERHLLLKSYCHYGWAGFRLVNRIETPDAAFFFLTSRFTTENMISGLVVVKSPLYAGISLGYSAGALGAEDGTAFWESAIFEALDKILALDGKPIDLSRNPGSWITSEMKTYLESPFDLATLEIGKDAPRELAPANPEYIQLYNLAELYGLDFPLYAAWAAGGDLIPLFSKSRLATEEMAYLASILARNSIRDLPERHPVL